MIDILLATYNGDKYLENQLYSLLSQTYKDWRLLIHDDGSTDDTLQIIQKFQDLDPRIQLLDDGIKCGGPAQNFLHLLKQSTADYTIFCDQDDIWFETKLADLKNAFENKPMLVFCDAYSYSENKGIIANKVIAVERKHLRQQLFLNGGIHGCSIMFNKPLRDKIHTIPPHQAMHDHFLTLFALSFGTLKYLNKSLMLYRQFHENKFTTNIDTSIIKRLASAHPVVERKHYIATQEFYNAYKEDLKPKQRTLFQEYFAYVESKSLMSKINIILRNNFSIYGSKMKLIVKTLIKPAIN